MRKISPKLINRLTSGDLQLLLEEIKRDPDLRLEVRRNGEAFVYYKKGKSLEIGSLKVDKKYGTVPDPNLVKKNPARYFAEMKKVIESWLLKHNARAEFETQQNIARDNQCSTNKYTILDMEYRFSQSGIEKSKREKSGSFDLLGINNETQTITFFEVKRGMKALNGKSGIQAHIDDFKAFLFGVNAAHYRANLLTDIKNIIEDKTQLGLLINYTFSVDLAKKDPELVFIFHPDNNQQCIKSILKGKYHDIRIKGTNYKLD